MSYIMRYLRFASTFLFFIFVAQVASSQTRDYSSYCSITDLKSPLRETQIIIDAALISPEIDKPLDENRIWRQRVAELLDLSSQSALKRWGARERFTLSIAEGDGSGLMRIFSGCVPMYSVDEERELNKKTGAFARFIGNDWERKHNKDVDDFRRALTFSMVMAARDFKVARKKSKFINSGMGQSLARGYRASHEYGTPRIIVITDLSFYNFHDGDISENRIAGREDAGVWRANLGRSEVHILGADGKTSNATKEYLNSLFLAAQGEVLTISGLSGALLIENIPETVDVYQGTVSFPDGEYPVIMRLALDQNRRAVNSWIEIQSDQLRFVPFDGGLSCVDDDSCTFLETGDFAQVWTDSPSGDPEFVNWMPFVGFRDMKFEIIENKVEGLITDSSGYVPGMESGLKFKLILMPDGTYR